MKMIVVSRLNMKMKVPRGKMLCCGSEGTTKEKVRRLSVRTKLKKRGLVEGLSSENHERCRGMTILN